MIDIITWIGESNQENYAKLMNSAIDTVMDLQESIHVLACI